MAKILIIDDEKSIRNILTEILENEKYNVDSAESGIEGLKLVNKNKYDAILCDIKMPKMDGMEALKHIKKSSPDVPIVMISGHGDIEIAVETIKNGAYDYISKPLDLNKLLITIRNATDKISLIKETKKLKKKIDKTWEMVGESEQLIKIKDMIERVAPIEARILIAGENGTSKELVARWIHEKSNRSATPFIEVNCAAIPSARLGLYPKRIRKTNNNFEII